MKSLFFFAATAQAVGPVQKVLQLIGDLKAKVTAEGEVEADQFAAFSKWCEDENRTKGYAIDTATSQSEDLSAEVQQATADIGDLAGRIDDVSQKISKAEGELSAAKSIRASERDDFQKADKELTDAVDELARASSVLRKAGLGGSSALQTALTQVAGGLSVVLNAATIDVGDRRKLAALLEASSGDEDLNVGAPEAAAYESHSGSILDTLSDLKVKAEREHAELRKEEMGKRHAFEMLQQSLVDSLAVLNRELRNSNSSKAEKEEVRGNADGDLSATQKRLSADQGYVGDLRLRCQQKSQDWEDRQKSRADEIATLDKAVEFLSGDKFQSAIGRTSPKQFVQVNTKPDVRERVARMLKQAAARLNSVGLAQLAVRTRSGDDPFGKVQGLISDMITRLMTQAAQEADHNEYCNSENAKSKAKRDKLSDTVDNQSVRLDKANAGVSKLKEENADLSASIAAMEKSMGDAADLRNKEKSAFNQNMADYKEAQTQLQAAIGALRDYFQNDASLVQAGPGPMWSGPYKAKSTTSIVGLLEVALSDYVRMEAEARTEEDDAIRTFDQMKQENSVNTAMKQTEIKSKEGEVARVSNMIRELKEDRSSSHRELDAVLDYLSKLKAKCEHTPMTFAERAAKRKSEIESLQEALRILETETAPAFLQKVRRHRG